MLLLRTEHPHFTRYQAFAAQQEMTVLPVSGAPLEKEIRHALASAPNLLLLAGNGADCSAWLGFCARLPGDQQPTSIACLGEGLSESALQQVLKATPVMRPLVELDHNLAAGPEVALELVWGAAIPIFDGKGAVEGTGLLSRAKGMVSSLREASKAWTQEEAAWALVGEKKRTSRGGFVRATDRAVPSALRTLLGDDERLWGATGSGLQPQDWQAVFESGRKVVQLVGDGELLVNGQRRRVRTMDAIFLRQLGTLPLHFHGFELVTAAG